MRFSLGRTCFICPIVIIISPLLLFVMFVRIRGITAKCPEALVQATFTVCYGPHWGRQSSIFHCVFGFGGDPLLCLFNKRNSRMSGLLVPSKPWESERHFARTTYLTCEKTHTRYTTSIRGPTFILVSHFISKINLITFLNERGKFGIWDVKVNSQLT